MIRAHRQPVTSCSLSFEGEFYKAKNVMASLVILLVNGEIKNRFQDADTMMGSMPLTSQKAEPSSLDVLRLTNEMEKP